MADAGSRVLSGIFGLPADYESNGPTLADLQPKYRRIYILGYLLSVPLSLVAGIGCWLVLRQLAAWNALRFEPALAQFDYAKLGMILPALFFGMCLCFFVLDRVLRIWLANDFALFVRYHNLRHQYDYERAVYPTVGFVIVPSIVIAIMVLNSNEVFYAQEMSYARWAGLSRVTQPYSAIESLKAAAGTKTEKRNMTRFHRYRINFANGTHWQVDHTQGKPDDETMRDVFLMLSKTTGKPIEPIAGP